MVRATHLITIAVIFFPASILATYIASNIMENMQVPSWYLVDYVDSQPLETCLFSFIYNTLGVMFFFMIYLRYFQLLNAIEKSELTERQTKKMRCLNVFSLVMGIFSSLGLSLMGSFQMRHFIFFHLMGSFFVLYFGLTYMILQVYFSFVIKLLDTNLCVKVFRTIIVSIVGLLLVILPIIVFIFLVNSILEADYIHIDVDEPTDEVLIKNDLESAVSEWFIMIMYQMYACTFWPDFKKIIIESDKIVFV